MLVGEVFVGYELMVFTRPLNGSAMLCIYEPGTKPNIP